jgi:O-antigen ligase
MVAVVAVPLILAAIVLTSLGKRTAGGLALLVLLYSRIAETPVANGAVRTAAEIAVIGVALIVFGIRTLQGGSRNLAALTGFWAAALLYLAVLYASSIWAVDASLAIHQANTLVKDLLVVYLIVEIFDTTRGQRLASWTLVTVGACLAAITIFQALTHTYGNSYLGLAQANIQQIVGASHGYRSAGPVGDPNFFGLALAAVVPLALFRLRDDHDLRLRVLAAAATILLLGGIVLTYSRAALVAVAAVVIIFIITAKVPLRLLLVGVLVVLPFAAVVPSQFWHRATSITVPDQSVVGRTDSDRVALDIFASHPLQGVGADNYHVTFFSHAVDLHALDTVPYAHDLYLATAAETGLLGLSTFGCAIWIVLSRAWRARREALNAGDEISGGLAGAHVLALVAFLIGSVFLPLAFPRYLWLLVGLALAITLPERGASPSSAAVKRGERRPHRS